jgi:hypothetical protein
MLVIYDMLMKHEIIKTMNSEIINTRAELRRSTTKQVRFSKEGVT